MPDSPATGPRAREDAQVEAALEAWIAHTDGAPLYWSSAQREWCRSIIRVVIRAAALTPASPPDERDQMFRLTEIIGAIRTAEGSTRIDDMGLAIELVKRGVRLPASGGSAREADTALAIRVVEAVRSIIPAFDWDEPHGKESVVVQLVTGILARAVPPSRGAREARPEEGELTACRAARDGECDWEWCPQLHDAETAKSGRHCPLDFIPASAFGGAAGDGPSETEVHRAFEHGVYWAIYGHHDVTPDSPTITEAADTYVRQRDAALAASPPPAPSDDGSVTHGGR